MSYKTHLLIVGITTLFLATSASAHPPEDMPWQNKRAIEYQQKKAEDAVKTESPAPQAEPVETIKDDPAKLETQKASPPKVVKTDSAKKKIWFARWKEKRAAKKAAKKTAEE